MTSRLAAMQARFQQKQMQEREEKLVKLYESQQQKAFERVGRGSAGSNTSLGSTGGGKVRQMFDERRKAGVDRSYPLEPLKSKPTSNMSQNRNGTTERLRNSSTVVKTQKTTMSVQSKNGKPAVVKKQGFGSIYSNINGNENYETYKFNNNNGVKKTSRSSDKDLVEMMNNHNLYGDNLDDEEIPNGLDDVDEAYTGKLSNLGGKLPSQKVAEEKSKMPLGKTFRKESKPIVKRTVRPIGSASGDKSDSPTNLVLGSPVPETMKKATSCPPTSEKTTRPSSKQTAKQPISRDDLAECANCHRHFASDRLAVHESICNKASKKKRRVYDATKHRVEGTELEQYTRKGTRQSTTRQVNKSVSKKDWRKTHEEFIQAIRAAKEAQAYVAKGGKLSDLPPPPPSTNPDYVPCPHCGRKFNESAAARHIPKCVNYEFNKPKPAATKGKARF